MEKIGAKGMIMSVLLPLMFVLQLSSFVGAVDIIFYTSTSGCNGGAYAFNGIAQRVCCAVSAGSGGSVLVTSTSGSGQKSQVYRNGACTSQVGSGSGNICYVGGQFTGAFWFNGRRRSLLAEVDESSSSSQTCDFSQVKPTGVVYSEDGLKGHWILTTDDAVELYEQMQSVPDAEKASWLQSRGASYKLLSSEMSLPTKTVTT